MKGLQLVQLNARSCDMVAEALRACDRLHRKIFTMIQEKGADELPLLVYDMFGTVPLTAHVLRMWADETAESEKEMLHRIEICTNILQEELRCNHVFEQYHAAKKVRVSK